MFPSLFKKSEYTQAINNAFEYLNVKTLIRRLQDIDKLKLVLFDEEQRKLFEAIPKPGITGNHKFYSNFLTLESIKPSKRKSEVKEMKEINELKKSTVKINVNEENNNNKAKVMEMSVLINQRLSKLNETSAEQQNTDMVTLIKKSTTATAV